MGHTGVFVLSETHAVNCRWQTSSIIVANLGMESAGQTYRSATSLRDPQTRC